MNLIKSTALAGALGAMAGTLIAVQVRAGGDKVAFPDSWAEGTRRARANRSRAARSSRWCNTRRRSTTRALR
jgi:hypothetical protein